jgi:lambda family phage minor tail protein L
MSSRFYDYIVQVSNANTFVASNSLFGANSNSFAEIVAVDGANLKVKVANISHYFEIGETVQSKATNIHVFYSSVTYSSTGIVVDGNTYSIDGSTNTFALPISADYKHEIQIYANNIIVPQDQYEFPSLTLDDRGVDFNNISIFITPTSNDEISIYGDSIYPPDSLGSLKVGVSRGIKESYYFVAANTPTTQSILASDIVVNVKPSNYVITKNSFEQEPVVRLYTIYYPGEWYLPNANGNPSGDGAGYPWPYPFPLRYAEVFGDDFNIPDYYIEHEGNRYKSFPITYPGISISSDGSIGEISLDLANTDYYFSTLVENPYIVGFNNTSAVSATVNQEVVSNIDPRTVPGNAAYDSNLVATLGQVNSAFSYDSTSSLNEEWISLVKDSRDLLGAVVEIKSIYASHLEYWPEYSLLTTLQGNVLTVTDTSPYRVGDSVQSNNGNLAGIVVSISNNNIVVDSASVNGITSGDKIYIRNGNYDPYAYLDHKFIVSKMVSYDDTKVVFNLSERTSQINKELPRRKFYKNTCPWKYKGIECKYPANGSGVIVNTYPETTANGMFTINNATTLDTSLDKCSKSITACRLRNNIQNFGGFPGTNDKL